jgi:Tetracyclin repressor-like, C-terminal domain
MSLPHTARMLESCASGESPPRPFEVMFNALLEAGSAAAEGGRGFIVLTETIREAQQQGEIRQDDPARLARVVWALVHGASML